MPAAKKTANLKSANLRKPLNKTTANKNSSRVNIFLYLYAKIQLVPSNDAFDHILDLKSLDYNRQHSV